MPLTVIIPTRDNGTDVQRFLESVRATPSGPEAPCLLVIDNGSRQAETCRILVELATRRIARELTLDEPFSWSHLNNRAVDEVETPLIVFANDDMVMLSEGWDDILRGLLDRPEIGAVGAGLLYPAKPSSMPAFFSAGRAGRLCERRWEPGPAYRWHVTRALAAVTGAFLATRRELFLTHGRSDEAGLPVNYGDIDYALKLQATGLKILWTREIMAYHHESKSRGLDYLNPENEPMPPPSAL
jgi:O-antigen biosynthesis protein